MFATKHFPTVTLSINFVQTNINLTHKVKSKISQNGKRKGENIKPKGYWADINNTIKFLNEFKQKYNLNTIEDWNSITINQIKLNGGRSLLQKYSIFEIKCLGCPEGKSFFQSNNKPNGYWKKHDNILLFLQQLKKKLNLNSVDDWNLITQNQIRLHGGSRLLSMYSIYDLKCLACPEGKLTFEKSNKPSGYWDKQENILHFLNQIKEKYNLNTFDDWNSITMKEIELNGGSRLFHKYSIYDLKCLGFPEGKDKFDKPNKSVGYWKEENNILTFLNELKLKYNLNSPKDWNSITIKQIQSNGGGSLLHKYSIYDLKCLGCPDGKFEFDSAYKPAGFWENENNIIQFLNHLKDTLNLKTFDDWNSITMKEIQLNGGNSLFQKFSLFDLKCLGFPKGKNKFDPEPKPSGYWNNKNNILQFLNELEIKLNLNTIEDWCRLSKNQIIHHGGIGLALNYSLQDIIKFKYPDVNVQIKSMKRSSQRWLFIQIQKLFPNDEIVEDYFHSEISRISGFAVQFDIFILNRKIAIEYQGKQHYEDIPSGFAPVEMYQNLDNEKAKLCKKYNIQLITIPYWWDNQLNSLQLLMNEKLKA